MKFKQVLPLLCAGVMFSLNASIVPANYYNDSYSYDSIEIQDDEGRASSTITYFNFDGKRFMHNAYISTSFDRLYVEAVVYTYDYSRYQGGISIEVYLYDDSGHLILSNGSGIVTDTIGVVASISRDYLPQYGTYRAQGRTTIWPQNGSSNSFYTTYTPFVNFGRGLHEEDRYNYDFENELAAAFEEALETNGMIKAKNLDGISGFVYAREVVGDLTTITDEVRFINLYDQDGVTVIGEFQIG